jgi:ComF family protein
MTSVPSSLSSVLRAGRHVAQRVLDLLAPPRCAGCDDALGSSEAAPAAFCPTCAATVTRSETSVELASSPGPLVSLAYGRYAGALGAALRRFKYHGRADLAAVLAGLEGGLLASRLATLGATADMVVPVPLHPARLAHRGFNQAALLARPLARELGAEVATGSLLRLRNTSPQARLALAERRLNVSQAFGAAHGARLCGRSILLVDDVATSGATLRACAEVLYQAGATLVTAWSVARAERALDQGLRAQATEPSEALTSAARPFRSPRGISP